MCPRAHVISLKHQTALHEIMGHALNPRNCPPSETFARTGDVTCMCACTCTCMHMCTCMCAHVHMCMHACRCACHAMPRCEKGTLSPWWGYPVTAARVPCHHEEGTLSWFVCTMI